MGFPSFTNYWKNNLKYNTLNSFPYHVGFAKPVCFYLAWFGWLGDSLARCFTWHCLKSDTYSVSNSFFRRENNLSGIEDVEIACVQFWGRQVTFELSWTASVGDGQMWCVPWVDQISPKKTTEVWYQTPLTVFDIKMRNIVTFQSSVHDN